MKKILTFIVLVTAGVLVLWGCKKDEPLQAYYPSDYGDLQYSIHGVRDTFLEQTGKVIINLFVERTAGAYEDVNLSVKNLPEGMTARFNPQSAVPSYNTTLTLETEQADVGDYTIQVVGASQTTGLKYYDMVVTVTPYTNPALGLDGVFKEERSCNQTGDDLHNVEITPVQGSVGKVSIKGIWTGNGSYIVTGTINSDNQTIAVPAQSVNGVVFEGNGTYTKNTMELAYTVKDTSTLHVVNDSCTSLFTKQ